MKALTSIEICAGAGGQALGLERAGFGHLAAVEIDPWACQTLRLNRPQWNVVGPENGSKGPFEGLPGDVRVFSGKDWKGQVDLLAGGVPCPPFSMAGLQLGQDDERDLFPEALRIARECEPRAIMLENVRGLLSPKFNSYRNEIKLALKEMGYEADWELFNASDFGVPQLRPRSILIALRTEAFENFEWPANELHIAGTVGGLLEDLMKANGWKGAAEWVETANRIGPTLVGGSKKHGGPDLGPTRAKKAWAELGVDGKGLANEAPERNFRGMPRLTARMTARLQGFPDEWQFAGKKTAQYRQIGNAFPPPVAHAVGKQIAAALNAASAERSDATSVAA